MTPSLGATDSNQAFTNPMLWRPLKGVMEFLQSNNYPHIPNPPSCSKRASVALILRFRPSIAHPAIYDRNICGDTVGTSSQRLESYFSQLWVQHAEPEILFIKRAPRTGDRWDGHVAFPGGGRDPQDADDCATSVRETREEVGIDLNADHCMLIGNLPEQVVTTWWSKIPLMVLCPYVHLVMRYDISPMILQPAEVKSAHWVSLRALLSPHLRTFERQDVSDRFFRQGNQLTKRILRSMVGQLLFTARRLVPTESTHSRSISDYAPTDKPKANPRQARTSRLLSIWQGPQPAALSQDPSLILWGLTYGIMANFLGLMPTEDPTSMWDWPTLSPWDIRFAVWALTYRYRAQKLRSLAHRMDAAVPSGELDERMETAGLDSQTFAVPEAHQHGRRTSLDTVTVMLDGYFDRLRKAIWMALAFRLGMGTLFVTMLLRRRYRQRLSRL